MEHGHDGFTYHAYNPGFVVLSYAVSLAGCWTSLELLHRRTGARGFYNWFLLLSAASTMGAVSIWSMHYIGNRAVIMDQGQANLQIQYSPGFTAGSFFLPIIVVAAAFYLFGTSENVSIPWTLVGGCLTGFAVVGMHYMGQGGISNYTCVYKWPYVLGSVLISVFATTVALGVFFHFRSTWTDSWWKRGSCASLLAIAVSGMHWTATVGTRYQARTNVVNTDPGLSRETTVVVVICLSIGCCLILFTMTLIGQRSRQLSADRAQQVVLACVTFDPEGKLMVTPGGLLPCRKITDSYLERSFDDVFDVNHPVFGWIFRASRCWQAVLEVLPGMRSHLRSTMPQKAYRQSAISEHRTTSGMGTIGDYSTLFRELFCVAAKDLADHIQEPLENIGVLFGSIMMTGTLSRTAKLRIRGLNFKRSSLDVAERAESPSMQFGRGQLLFIVRSTNAVESSRLQSIGHRFANLSHVAEQMARSMEVTREELLPRLERMRAASLGTACIAPGIHISCFALRPRWHRGFDVLVPNDANYLLPCTSLTREHLEEWQSEYLQRMDNLTSLECCDYLRGSQTSVGSRECTFAGLLLEAITQLFESIDDPAFWEARLVARPMQAYCSHDSSSKADNVFLVSFRVLVDAHQYDSINAQYNFTPLKFFLCQQRAFRNGPEKARFARQIHREFAGFTNSSSDAARRISTRTLQVDRNMSIDTMSEGSLNTSPPRKSRRWFEGFDVRDDASSEKNLVHMGVAQPHGGIYVSNDIEVDMSESRRDHDDPQVEMRDFGIRSVAGVGDSEEPTFADKLFALTIDEKRKQPLRRLQ